MRPKPLKVGELAQRTGVSVRTLHHYDDIGLLTAHRGAGGQRLYGEEQVVRLLRIRSLQQLGFSLDEIRGCLDDAGYSPVRLLEMQLSRLRERLAQTERLCGQLDRLLARLRAQEEVTVSEFLHAIEEMTMFEKYYTTEQLAWLKKRREEVGEARIREVEEEWPQLIASVRAEMDKGTDPSDPKVRTLAARWHALIEEFTGGDPGIRESLRRMYAGEASVRAEGGLDGDILDYVARAK